MLCTSTPFEGLYVFEPRLFPDERGYFFESFQQQRFEEMTGIQRPFVQDNQAWSRSRVIRGLHFQRPPRAQAKLIRALSGTIWDLALDLRKDQPTYGQWYGIELSAENKKQFYIPAGFAHGYAVLSEEAEVLYKCDEYYDPSCEAGVRFDDPDIAVDWKLDPGEARVSDKDLRLPGWKEFEALGNLF